MTVVALLKSMICVVIIFEKYDLCSIYEKYDLWSIYEKYDLCSILKSMTCVAFL